MVLNETYRKFLEDLIYVLEERKQKYVSEADYEFGSYYRDLVIKYKDKLKMVNENNGEVFRDPSLKTEDCYKVKFSDKVCSPNFNSAGAAYIYLVGLRQGGKPEYSE